MRFVLMLSSLLLPTTALAQSVPVRLEHRGDGWLHASLIVGWHSEPYRAVYVTNDYVHHYTAWRSVPDTTPLCTAPCMTVLPSEPSQLVLRDQDGWMTTSPFLPMPGATLLLSVDRHGVVRGFGQTVYWLGFLGTLAGACFAGTDLILDEISRDNPHYDSFLTGDLELGAWIATGASAALWLLLGLPLMNLGDGAHVEVIPGGVRF